MTKSVYRAEVPAKINMSLAITGKMGGLHTLEMTVCPYSVFKDEAEFYPSYGSNRITVDVSASFDGFDERRFLEFYLPKVSAIAEKLGVGGKLKVCKNVPLGAGLGGSTASIVCALLAMSEYSKDLGVSARLDDGFLLELGSDVPCMLLAKPCIVRGVGEIIEPLEIDVPEFTVRIAEGGSDTKACYALYDEMKKNNPKSDTSLNPLEKSCVAGEWRNDLTAPAVQLNPRIGRIISEMNEIFDYVVMSGSGSAVVGWNEKF